MIGDIIMNKKHEQEAKTRGITLIALIITIIILLILAGISLSTLNDDGLFGRAKKAASAFTNATEYEQAIVNQINLEYDQNMNPNSGEGGNAKGNSDLPLDGNLNINVTVANYNSTLQSAPIIFGVTEIVNGELAYANIVPCEFNSSGIKTVSTDIPLVDGAQIGVYAVCVGGAYNIDKDAEQIDIQNNSISDANFTVNYNNNAISSTYQGLTFNRS
jgi:type II secretory pathway pseudopilin PulG